MPVNGPDFLKQVEAIRTTSPRLYNQYSENFRAVENWLRSGADTAQLRQFNLHSYQMEGKDNYGNVQFTGYYTPVVQARHTRQGSFSILSTACRRKGSRLPSRAQIYNGALSDNYVLAYSNSLMDNFLMDVQGSAYIDFGDGSELNFSRMREERARLYQYRACSDRSRRGGEERYVDAGDPPVGR